MERRQIWEGKARKDLPLPPPPHLAIIGTAAADAYFHGEDGDKIRARVLIQARMLLQKLENTKEREEKVSRGGCIQ